MAKRFKNKNKPVPAAEVPKKQDEPKQATIKEEENTDDNIFSKPNVSKSVKTSTLFDADSDSDDGGLFGSYNKNKTANKKSVLFDDEVEEKNNDEVVADLKPKLPAGATALFKDQHLESALQKRFNPEKTETNKKEKSLFEDDDEEEDDFFKPKKTTVEKVEATKKPVINLLADDDDEIPVAKPPEKKVETKKVKTLFDDSEDDDSDLFSAAKPKPKSSEAEKPKPKPSEVEKPKPVATAAPKSLFDDEEDDDLFNSGAKKPTEATVEQTKQIKIRKE